MHGADWRLASRLPLMLQFRESSWRIPNSYEDRTVVDVTFDDGIMALSKPTVVRTPWTSPLTGGSSQPCSPPQLLCTVAIQCDPVSTSLSSTPSMVLRVTENRFDLLRCRQRRIEDGSVDEWLLESPSAVPGVPLVNPETLIFPPDLFAAHDILSPLPPPYATAWCDEYDVLSPEGDDRWSNIGPTSATAAVVAAFSRRVGAVSLLNVEIQQRTATICVPDSIRPSSAKTVSAAFGDAEGCTLLLGTSSGTVCLYDLRLCSPTRIQEGAQLYLPCTRASREDHVRKRPREARVDHRRRLAMLPQRVDCPSADGSQIRSIVSLKRTWNVLCTTSGGEMSCLDLRKGLTAIPESMHRLPLTGSSSATTSVCWSTNVSQLIQNRLHTVVSNGGVTQASVVAVPYAPRLMVAASHGGKTVHTRALPMDVCRQHDACVHLLMSEDAWIGGLTDANTGGAAASQGAERLLIRPHADGDCTVGHLDGRHNSIPGLRFVLDSRRCSESKEARVELLPDALAAEPLRRLLRAYADPLGSGGLAQFNDGTITSWRWPSVVKQRVGLETRRIAE